MDGRVERGDIPPQSIGHRDRERSDPPHAALREREHLHVQFEGMRTPSHLPLVLGDRAGVGAVGGVRAAGRRMAVPLGRGLRIRQRRLRVRDHRASQHVAAFDRQRQEGLEVFDEIQRNGRGMRLRLDRHRPVLPPLAFEAQMALVRHRRNDARHAPQRGELIGRADAERLAQVEREQHRPARVFANPPVRPPGVHAAIVGPGGSPASG